MNRCVIEWVLGKYCTEAEIHSQLRQAGFKEGVSLGPINSLGFALL